MVERETSFREAYDRLSTPLCRCARILLYAQAQRKIPEQILYGSDEWDKQDKNF